MSSEDSSKSDRYADYRQEVAETQIVGSLRAGILVVVGLHMPVFLLDYMFFREDMDVLAAIRGSNALTLGLMWLLASRWPVPSMQAALLLAGFHLIAVIAVAGGVSSIYYPAIMLLFLGMPVLLPLTARQAVFIVSSLYVVFAAQPALGFGEFATREYVVNLLLPGLAAIECVLSCALLDGLRYRDYLRREEIAAARDELAKLDDAKTRFSANVHHELRTPLTLMLAPLDGLREGDYGTIGDAGRRVVETMHSNGRRLLKLINNLLDLAKLEKREFSIVRQPIDLADFLRELVEGTQGLAEVKGLAVSTEFDSPLPSVFADRDALDKIMINLIGNAMKFTDSGGAVVVAARTAGDGVEISVSDSGIGLDAEQLERIFDRFAQVDCSATRKHEGTGIGLSLAMELVELHEGRIWATSDGIGRGATMHVLLPKGEADVEEESLADVLLSGVEIGAEGELAPEECLEQEAGIGANGETGRFVDLDASMRRWLDQSAGQTRSADQESSRDAATRPPVLVVDDNADMRDLLSFILGKEFYVRTARNGIEALESLRQNEPLLVVTDVMMPEMSGTELCEVIKSDPKRSHVPVMIVSSKAEDEMRVKGLELGADDYVTKPFHPREITARARSLVRLRQAQRDVADRNAQLENALNDLRRAQDQLVQSERLAAVGEMAAGIAHEVNNPVNFALNAARALQVTTGEVQDIARSAATLDWSDPERLEAQGKLFRDRIEELGGEELGGSVEELTKIVAVGLERTQKLVGDLRDFASPKPQASHRRVDLRAGVGATADLMAHEFVRAGVQFVAELPDRPVEVVGDLGALNQVVLNLLKNALDAFDSSLAERVPKVTLSLDVDESDVRVVVEDNGPGISEEALARLFEPFFSTKEAGRGTGLGLSMSLGIAEGHGGRLLAESTLGEGAKFVLVIPVAESAANA